MTAELTNRIMAQGRALARAIEALSIIKPAGLLLGALAETTRARGGKD